MAGAWNGSAESAYDSRYSPVIGTRGMVVSDERLASQWGAEILRQGGNAVDAAVATAFMLAVTRPQAGSLGGGGFLLYCPKPGPSGAASPCQALDYREVAPAGAARDMYVRDGKPRTDLSQDGALAVAVPGVTAGLIKALEKWGSVSRQKILSRPMEVARAGIELSGATEFGLTDRWEAFNPEARRIFGCRSGAKLEPCPTGTRIRQPELAKVLEAISREGRAGFYGGRVARAIVRDVREAGGILAEKDLADYQPKLRKPVRGTYRGMEVVSMPPPSSGGAIVVQMLAYMERAEAQLASGFGSAPELHAVAHAMALAFADRAVWFGDPDQVMVPLEGLLAPAYLDERWAESFRKDRAALPESAGKPGVVVDGNHTTHFSVIDREGNAVSVTTTINDNFGSGFVPAGTGVFLNNEMDDFSIQPGVPNLFGLVGAESNAVGPGKKPLSSMSPTIVRDERGNARLVLGAAGGPRIATSVFSAILNRVRFGMSIVDAIAAPRIHHQWRPLELRYEPQGFAPEVEQKLRQMGYLLKPASELARAQALERFPESGRTWGAPDFRGEGFAAAE